MRGNLILAMGAPYVHIGILNDNSSIDRSPLGPDVNDNSRGQTLNNHACKGLQPTESLPMYALSGLFVVEQVGATIAPRATAAEGSTITFTVTIPDAAPSGGITIPYTFSDGLGIPTDPAHTIATSADYTGTAGSVVIAQGQTSNTFTVPTTNDSTYEGDHYFRVILGTPTGTNAPRIITGKHIGVGVITDDADLPTLAFSPATASVTEGTSSVDVTVTKTGTTEVPLSVYWTTADGTAAHPTDYMAQSGYLEFDTTETTKTLTIPIIDDGTAESAETFNVRLDSGLVVDAQVGSTGGRATITLNDDDSGGDVMVSWSQTDDSDLPGAIQVTEGGPSFTVKVSLSSAAPAGGISIPIALMHFATAAGDITVPASVTIAAGQTSATFTVQANIDELLEGSETFQLTLCPTTGDNTCPAGYTSGDTPPLVVGQALDPGMIADFSKLVTFVRATKDSLGTTTFHPGQEGGEITLGVKLELDPLVDVTITPKVVGGRQTGVTAFLPNLINGTATEFVAVDTDPDTDGLQSTLTFTGGNAGNWNTEQFFTLHFLYDDDVTNAEREPEGQAGDEYTIGFLNEAASGPYKEQTHNGALHVGLTEFRVADAGNAVVVSPDEVTVAASGTVEYDVQLASDPGGTVVVTPTSSDTAKASVSSALTFMSSNWNTPQQITVSGVGAGMTTITHAVTTATTAYPVSMTIEDVDVTVTAAGAVNVEMSGSDGDSNGNAVEGASNTTGYRTITLTLSRALAGSETITVPLTVVGATVTTDYTFALQPSTQTGVTLTTTGGTHTEQNPAVEFASGAQTATLRLTPVDNNDRTQPYVVIDYGTGATAPSGSGLTLGATTGGPIGVVLVDDETGDIEVPSNWSLTPSGIAVGREFRLLFRTSTGRDATSSDITVYDAFVRGVLADTGHADIKPYAGFFKVFGSTLNALMIGQGGTTARVHNGMNTIHVGHLTDAEADGGIWEDGSTSTRVGNNAIGVPTYWLNGAILANNYADMCDLAWSSGDGVTTGWDTDDPRSEDGTRNIPSGAISDYAPYETWTGTGNACEAYNHPFGFTTVSKSSADSGGGQSLLHDTSATNTGTHPFYGYSPVFKVVAAPVLVSWSQTDDSTLPASGECPGPCRG